MKKKQTKNRFHRSTHKRRKERYFRYLLQRRTDRECEELFAESRFFLKKQVEVAQSFNCEQKKLQKKKVLDGLHYEKC